MTNSKDMMRQGVLAVILALVSSFLVLALDVHAAASVGRIDEQSRNAIDQMQVLSQQIQNTASATMSGDESSFTALAREIESFGMQQELVDSNLLADQLSRVNVAWQPIKRSAQKLVDLQQPLIDAQWTANAYGEDMEVMQREFSAVNRIIEDYGYNESTALAAQENLTLNERIYENINAMVTGPVDSDRISTALLYDAAALLGNVNALNTGDPLRGINRVQQRIAVEALSSASRRLATLSGSIEKLARSASQLEEAAAARSTLADSADALQRSLIELKSAADQFAVAGEGEGENTMMTYIAFGVAALAIALLIAQFVLGRRKTQQTKEGLVEIKTALYEMSQGNFNVTVSEDNAATADFARQFNSSCKRQRELVKNIYGPFEQSVDEINKIGISAKGLVEKGKELTQSVSESISATTEMVRTSEEIKKSTGEAARTSDRNCQEVAQGYGLTKDMSKASVDVRESVQSTSKSAKRQSELIQSVTAAAEYIQALNTKISVVAINTRIEAEKAGEYGRPFLGIAEAIADLLREAQDEGRKIISEVRMLQNMSAENLSSMENTVGTVVTILEYIERLDSSLEEINSGSAAISSIIRSVDEAAGKSAVSALHMNSSMTQMRERNEEIGTFSESTRVGVGRLQKSMRDAADSLGKFKAGRGSVSSESMASEVNELEPIGVAKTVYREEDMSALEASEQARASV
ncbi:MAG: methyl-accepting chemotaxis protein [Pseudomonadota bacterium]